MSRRPIKIFQVNEDEPSANIKIKCSISGQFLKWNDAVRANWEYDFDVGRISHTQYYSIKE